MTTDEKLAVLARAILQLAKAAAHVHDFDGEQRVSEGVDLPLDLEQALEAIANEAAGERSNG